MEALKPDSHRAFCVPAAELDGNGSAACTWETSVTDGETAQRSRSTVCSRTFRRDGTKRLGTGFEPVMILNCAGDISGSARAESLTPLLLCGPPLLVMPPSLPAARVASPRPRNVRVARTTYPQTLRLLDHAATTPPPRRRLVVLLSSRLRVHSAVGHAGVGLLSPICLAESPFRSRLFVSFSVGNIPDGCADASGPRSATRRLTGIRLAFPPHSQSCWRGASSQGVVPPARRRPVRQLSRISRSSVPRPSGHEFALLDRRRGADGIDAGVRPR